jgi:hypothetical protein
MKKVDPDTKLQAQLHVIRLLNELDSVLCGWVLQFEREKIEKLTGPLYELVDED